MVKLATWLVNAQPLPKVVAMTANASIVAKKGETLIFQVDLILTQFVVIQRRTVQILGSSKASAESVRKKVTLLPNALTSLSPNVTTASKKVPYHSSQCASSLVPDTASRSSNL